MANQGPGAGSLPAGAGGAGGSGPSPIGPVAVGGILDTALNPLASGSTASMLGYVEISADDLLQLQMYFFLIEIIRIEDANNGDLFLKRFLEGPQTVWEDIQAKIFAIKNLWSVSDIPDEYLKYLKNIVGWTGKREKITDALNNDTLRRLIANSVNLWKSRGPEETITSIVTLVTGARTRSWNWFDYRWVQDETGLGHDISGYDPWLLEIDNDREMNVRIMDPDGSIDRELIKNLLKLVRPCGERFEITYLNLIDIFNIDGDDTQWGTINDAGSDSTTFTVASGSGTLTDLTHREEIYSNIDGADSWSQYMFSARLRGEDHFGITFYRANENNYYVFRLNTTGVADNFELIKRVAGVESTIASSPVPAGYIVDPLLYYMFRVTTAVEGTATRIQCYIDGVEIFSALDSQFAQGTVGVIHGVGGASVEVDEIEVMSLPADSDCVDINS